MAKTKVLIIEDELILAEMYKDKFEQAGFEVALAFSTEEGVSLAKKGKSDLILLDILLPKGNGIQFLKEIQELPEIKKIPIVVISNYDDPKTKMEAFSLGVKAYLIKTKYTPNELLEEVKKFLPSNTTSTAARGSK